MSDAVYRLALQRAAEDARQIVDDVTAGKGPRPLLSMLAKAKDEAAEAMELLVAVAPSDSASVQKYQNDVRRFDDLVRWIKDLIDAGLEADRLLSEGEADDLLGYLTDPDGAAEAQALGIPQGAHPDA